ncbi:MAG: hypothetical protein J5791_06210 [Fibrobacter sp.]|nr:hypothetical protein [Fibrobacter sp.]
MARFWRKQPVANLLMAVACALLLAACNKQDVKPDMRLVEAFVEVRVIEQTYGAESPAARLSRQATLQKYGYTTESFAQACDAVLNDDAMWLPFEQAVTERIDSLLGIPKPVKEKKKGDKK